jgi:predicted phage-related endonuclease
MERPDLSNIEAVQMGHVMEPVIGQLAQKAIGVELQKIEDAYTHKTEPWLKSHFDFVGRGNDGQAFLVEAKNYNAGTRNKFDADSGLMPFADLSQLVHEATVFGVEKVYLAVLFGGQEFVLIPKTITEDMKENHVKDMAVLWAHVQAGTALAPETTDQARALYPASQEGLRTASQNVEQAAAVLSKIKAQIKGLEEQEDQLATMLQGYLADSDTLVTVDGRVLATWKSAKPSMKFDSKLFATAMPDIYRQFTVSSPGSRRFLLK